MNTAKENQKDIADIRLIVFELFDPLNHLSYALNTHKVVEVIELEEYDLLPNVYFPYIGMINLRGVPVPIMDIHPILNDKKETKVKFDKDSTRIIICELLGKTFGIVANKKIRMIEVENTNVHPVNFNNNNMNTDYIANIVEYGSEYIYMINLEIILNELHSDDKVHTEKVVKVKPSSNLKVLVVEDSKFFRRKASNFFRNIGFHVEEAIDGVDGLEKVLSGKKYNLVYTDIEMPRLNGISMIRELKLQGALSNTHVIFNSSMSNENLGKEIYKESLGDFINKQDEDKLVEILDGLFN